MVLEWLDTSVDDAANFAGVSPVGSDMDFVSVTGQKSLGNAAVTANITNVLGLSNVNHIHMILQVTSRRKFLVAMGTHDFAVSSIVDVVDLVEMIIVEEDADVLLAVLAEALCMPGSEMQLYFLLTFVSEKHEQYTEGK